MDIFYEGFIDRNGIVIEDILKNKNANYNIFTIPKSNGKKRIISEPRSELKQVQKILNEDILYPKRYLIHPCAYAYVPGKSIKDCISKHTQKDVVVKIDIKDFFSSITEKLVMDAMLYTFRMEPDTAKTITEICTLNGSLPQGAVTSPILSNYVCRILDRRLYGYCSRHNIDYTRYADDLIFSGNFDTDKLIKYVSWALKDYYGFKINYDKLRIMRKHQRQVVLGVLVNQNCRLTKKKRSELRQTLYFIKKFGYDSYFSYTGKTLQQLRGYINYAIDINREPDLLRLWDLLCQESDTIKGQFF